MAAAQKRIRIYLGIGAAFAAILGIARLNQGKDRIPWREDFPAARKESALNHKPIFLYFTAQWCEPCQSLKTSTWAAGTVASALTNYVPVRIDIDAHPELAQQYGLQSIPLFLILDGDAKPIKRSEGYLGPDEFLEWLKR